MKNSQGPILVLLVLSQGYGQTLVDLRTQTKSVDFTGANTTKPFKSGTTLPVTCSIGEAFFKTNASAGANLYSCTALNAWTLEAGTPGPAGPQGPPMNVAVGGITQATQPTLNFNSGNGIIEVCSNNAGANRVDCMPAVDTAFALSRATDQAGDDKRCISANGAAATHTCALNAALSIYTQNMELMWTPDVACQGSDTINVNALGPIPIDVVNASGALSAIAANQCRANVPYILRAHSSGPPVVDAFVLAPDPAMPISANFIGTSAAGNPVAVQGPFVDWQKQTGSISITNGSDTTIFSTSIPGGLMAAGHCLVVSTAILYTNVSTLATAIKIKYGTGSVIITSPALSRIDSYRDIMICNNPGATGTQQISLSYFDFASSPGVNGTDFARATPVASVTVDTTATQMLTLVANAGGSGDSVVGEFWRVLYF
ncbi:MAG TPA: hypothetical protein VK776_10775 [Bryobacteraceae bacterium]|nr:hypothetical protein [Bryobacteraceae bacterium]